MKILMVNKFLYPNGGSETYMFKLGKYFSDNGHEVEYFGMEHPDRCVENSANAYTENMDFHTASALRKIKMSFKTVYSKEAYNKMLLVLNSFSPEVVHLNNFNYQLTPTVIQAVRDWEKSSNNRVKIIYTAHDYQLICPNHAMFNNGKICRECSGGKFISCLKGKCIHSSALKSLFGAMEAYFWTNKGIYEQLDKIICCSEFMKSKLDEYPIFKNKTVTMHNFIESTSGVECEKEDYVLYFGRLSEEKGIDTILNCKDVKFKVAGTGEYEEKIKSADNIEYLGFKTGDELKELISKARLTVYPSVWYENCPFSVMESIMYGTPVVGSKIGGIPELIDDGETGLLFEPNNTQDFKNAILSILNNDEAATRMSKACFDKKFDTLEQYAEKLMNIYKQ